MWYTGPPTSFLQDFIDFVIDFEVFVRCIAGASNSVIFLAELVNSQGDLTDRRAKLDQLRLDLSASSYLFGRASICLQSYCEKAKSITVSEYYLLLVLQALCLGTTLKTRRKWVPAISSSIVHLSFNIQKGTISL